MKDKLCSRESQSQTKKDNQSFLARKEAEEREMGV